MLTCFTCCVPYVPACLCVTALCVPSFFTCLTYLHFLRALCSLRTFIFYESYMPYVPYFFMCLTCLHFFICPHFVTCLKRFHFFACLYFLYNCILFMYMLIKFTQINELIYDCSSLLLLNFSHLSTSSITFTSIKLVSYSA